MFASKHIPKFYTLPNPASADYLETGLTKDGNYHTLDLSSKVPLGSKYVSLRLRLKTTAGNGGARFRNKGDINDSGTIFVWSQVANTFCGFDLRCDCDNLSRIEYSFSNTTWTNIYLTVMGYYR